MKRFLVLVAALALFAGCASKPAVIVSTEPPAEAGADQSASAASEQQAVASSDQATSATAEQMPGERRRRRMREPDGLTDQTYMTQYSYIPWVEIGRSVEDRPIYKVEFGTGEDVTLFFSCFHGAERSTPRFGFEFADMLYKNPSLVAAGKKVIVVPILNPDGFVRGSRNNANDVDLNRNYPTSNWGQQPTGEGWLQRPQMVDFGPAPASEPETRWVLKLLADVQPDKIVSVHQPRNCNNNDGPNGLVLAELLAKYNGYPVEPYIGYPTPGSFGTYAGKELGIPMLTLELPSGSPNSPAFDEMWAKNKEGLVAIVNFDLPAPVAPPDRAVGLAQ